MGKHVTFHQQKGFTLVELITVIIVLGVVSIGVTSFIRSGVQIFNDVSERDELLSQSRFVLERLNRELRSAVPNSARVAEANGSQCIEFVPTAWATYYTRLPIVPSTERTVNTVELGDINSQFSLASGDMAVVYPTDSDDVFDVGRQKRRSILSCTDSGDGNCGSNDSPEHLATLTVDGAFADISPASRLYIVRNAVSYCVRGGSMFRHQTSIGQTQTVFGAGGTLMAENIINDLSVSAQLPFTIQNATLNRNSLIQILLAFELNDETINLSSDIHVPNVP
ncbi:prepilin-type N-terminal cleavage/methylation domain-containing protein [Paraglaciecola chathamensis]|uniref:Prepilin-type N-terminal cleavage/methylation domain-containing protein n=1 Tax=Paraglaciecola chathamensis TaxID=368405 RepID=A0ABS0WE92_9ALTE|nr:prepilin-type N-terminal cleavage/methylation domain-containing protein [Paraglaciecola chathamensis]MBJ2136767.1 prepilin-type N-terminal cleavage/methylation domain-containing protein [Paraglaciecola chathamensis]